MAISYSAVGYVCVCVMSGAIDQQILTACLWVLAACAPAAAQGPDDR